MRVEYYQPFILFFTFLCERGLSQERRRERTPRLPLTHRPAKSAGSPSHGLLLAVIREPHPRHIPDRPAAAHRHPFILV